MIPEKKYKEKYKTKLEQQEKELRAFEDKHKDVFNEWSKLRSSIADTKLYIENETWRVGKYYRMYGDVYGDFYIHVKQTLRSGNELYGKVIRIIKPEYSDTYFSSAVIIEGGLQLSQSGAVKLVQITKKEFNKAAEGLPVYYDGRQRRKYE